MAMRRGHRGVLAAEKPTLTRPVGVLLKGVVHYLGPHKWAFIAGAFLVALNSIISIIAPLYLASGIDILDLKQSNLNTALLLAGIFLGLTVFGWIIQSVSTRILAKTRSEMLYDVRQQLFDTLIETDLSYIKNEQSGNVTARITGDTEEVGSGLDIMINTSVQILLLVGSFVIIILKVHWWISLIALASIPVALVLSSILSYFGRRIIIRVRRVFGEVSGKMAENLSGISVSKAFNREEEIAAELKQLNAQHYRYNKQFGLLMQFMMPTINFVGVITTGSILLVGGILYSRALLTAGEIYLGIVLAQRFLRPVIMVSMSWTQLQSSLGAMDRIIDVLELEPTIVDSSAAQPLKKGDDSVTFEHVYFAYDNDNYVLEDITLKVQSGETIAIVGETGAGKTTLCTVLLPRFYDPQEGRILIGDQDIRDVELHSLRGSIGMILQEPYLFTDTVMENIRYAAPDATEEQIRELCKLIGADEFIEALPQGYDTIVREGGKKLSAGQRQMITIARTMLADPRILVLDEATSRLDTYSESLVQRAQEILFQNRTTFVIAHRLSTIRNANRIAVIHQGRLAELGTHEELLQKAGLYAELYNTYYAFQGFEQNIFSEEFIRELEAQERKEVQANLGKMLKSKPLARKGKAKAHKH